MNKLPLFACFAAAATAAAADLKDPADVARDWNQTIEQARPPATSPRNLLEQSTALPTGPTERAFHSKTPLPPLAPRPPGQLYDAPSYKIPRVLPDNLPPGAKPWQYDGRTYWLIPLGADADR